MADNETDNPDWIVVVEDRVLVCDGEYGPVVAIIPQGNGLRTEPEAIDIARKMSLALRMLAVLEKLYHNTPGLQHTDEIGSILFDATDGACNLEID